MNINAEFLLHQNIKMHYFFHANSTYYKYYSY